MGEYLVTREVITGPGNPGKEQAGKRDKEEEKSTEAMTSNEQVSTGTTLGLSPLEGWAGWGIH